MPSFNGDGAGIAVDRDTLATNDATRRIAGPQDGRDAVFTGDDRTVGENATDIRDQSQGVCK